MPRMLSLNSGGGIFEYLEAIDWLNKWMHLKTMDDLRI